MAESVWVSFLEKCHTERTILVNDLKAIEYMLGQEDLQAILNDSFPGSDADIVAKKLRKGLFLSSVNRFETFISNISIEFANAISGTDITYSQLRRKVTGNIRNLHMQGLKELHKDSFLPLDDRDSAAIIFADGIRSTYGSGQVKFDARPYFVRSNINVDLINKVANDFRLISERISYHHRPKLERSSWPDVVDFQRFAESVSSVWYEDFDIFGGFSRRVGDSMALRHRCAHDADYSPGVTDLDRLRDTISLAGDIFTSYILVLVVMQFRAVAGFEIHGPKGVPAVSVDPSLNVVGDTIVGSVVIDPIGDAHCLSLSSHFGGGGR